MMNVYMRQNAVFKHGILQDINIVKGRGNWFSFSTKECAMLKVSNIKNRAILLVSIVRSTCRLESE